MLLLFFEGSDCNQSLRSKISMVTMCLARQIWPQLRRRARRSGFGPFKSFKLNERTSSTVNLRRGSFILTDLQAPMAPLVGWSQPKQMLIRPTVV